MKKRHWAGFLWMLALVGCVTIPINIYFPAAAIENAAEKIETEVRGATPEQSSRVVPSFFIQRAYAVDVNVETPKIRKIVESRKARFPQVDQMLSDGFAGEGNNGYLKEKDRGVYGDLKKLADARRVMAEENKDRKELYLEIVRANNIPEEKVKEVEKIFAETNRGKLKAGQYYEDETGAWVKKG